MSIILAIFKIIALIILIILSVVVGLLLLVALLLLFPIKYNVVICKDSSFYYNIIVSWLFGAVMFYTKCNESGEPFKFLRVFFKVVFDDSESSVDTNNGFDSLNSEHGNAGVHDFAKKDNTKKVDSTENKNSKKEKLKKKSESVNKKKRLSFMSLVNYPERDIVICEFIILLKRLFKAISPDFFSLNCAIGLDDPAYTGILIGLLNSIIGLANLDISVSGIFDEGGLVLDFKTKGNVRILVVLWILVVFAVKKPIWKLIKLFLKERKVYNG